jgi:hypothetical protein
MPHQPVNQPHAAVSEVDFDFFLAIAAVRSLAAAGAHFRKNLPAGFRSEPAFLLRTRDAVRHPGKPRCAPRIQEPPGGNSLALAENPKAPYFRVVYIVQSNNYVECFGQPD